MHPPTSKAYRLYDESNKKFIISRDVIFFEFDKDDLNINTQLAHLDRFHSHKFYHECDNELPTLEGGFPFLGQSLEVSSHSLEVPENEDIVNEDSSNDDSNDEESEPVVEPTCEETDSKILEPEQVSDIIVRRSMQTWKVPRRYDDFILHHKTETESSTKQNKEKLNSYDVELNFSTVDEPSSFQEEATSDAWKISMQREYDVVIKNGTWRLVNPPIGTKPIGCKWVYKNKYKVDGSLDKHKARLVAKGYAKKEGVDYTETFAPTIKWGTIRTLFSLAAQKGWHIHHMDVKTAFLNGDLKEDVYMVQPKGFVVKGQEQKVYNLVKSLYGLKQAPRTWYEN